MTHYQISTLVQIQFTLGELRNNSIIALCEAATSLERVGIVIDRIEAEQRRIAELLSRCLVEEKQ